MKRAPVVFLPSISLDASARPIHRQIYEGLRRAITDGTLRPGETIPSTRSLATELKVSRISVLTACEQLQAEGYLESFVGAGTRVAACIPDDSVQRSPARGPGRCNAPRRFSRWSEAALALPRDPTLQAPGAFRVSSPALDRFPTKLWASLLRRHARSMHTGLMAYGDPMGHSPFREAIATYLGAARAVRCDASQIMVTSGSQQGLRLCASALLDAHDRVWIEEPGYPGAQRALTSAGVELIPIPVDDDGLNVEQAQIRCPDARAVYITPSHQYPMGVMMNAARRLQLLAWSARTGSWIIEDDYDSEYRFNSRPLASLQGLDDDDRVIYLGTFSKVLFPALRVGYLVIPKDLVPAFCAARDALDIFPPLLHQAALTDFLVEGHFTRHLGRMRTLYKQRCAALAAALRSRLDGRFQILNAEAGMHLVALLPPDVDDREISLRAASRGLTLTPLSSCCLESPPRRGLILGYASVSPAQISAGVDELAAILEL